MGFWSKNTVNDPVSGKDFTIYGHDNEAQANIAFATNAANLALAEKQNQWNIDQWNRQNEYNSPSHQLELLAKAGINPNTYSPQGMTAADLQSADLSVLGTPQLTANEDSTRFRSIMDSIGGVSDQVLNALSTIYQSENLKAGIAESKQRQQFAKELQPFVVDRARSEANSAAYRANADSYLPSMSYNQAQLLEKEVQNYDEKFREDLRLTKSSSYLNYKKGKEALQMIDKLGVETDLLKWERDFKKATGIDPHADGISSLIQLMLSDPSQGSYIIDRLIDNITNAGKHIISKIFD